MVRLLAEEGGFSTDDGLLTAVSGVFSHTLSSSNDDRDNVDDDDKDVFFVWASGVLMLGIDWLSDKCFWGLSGSLFVSSLSSASVFDNEVTLRLTLDSDAVKFAFEQRLVSMFHSRT